MRGAHHEVSLDDSSSRHWSLVFYPFSFIFRRVVQRSERLNDKAPRYGGTTGRMSALCAFQLGERRMDVQQGPRRIDTVDRCAKRFNANDSKVQDLAY